MYLIICIKQFMYLIQETFWANGTFLTMLVSLHKKTNLVHDYQERQLLLLTVKSKKVYTFGGLWIKYMWPIFKLKMLIYHHKSFRLKY